MEPHKDGSSKATAPKPAVLISVADKRCAALSKISNHRRPFKKRRRLVTASKGILLPPASIAKKRRQFPAAQKGILLPPALVAEKHRSYPGERDGDMYMSPVELRQALWAERVKSASLNSAMAVILDAAVRR